MRIAPGTRLGPYEIAASLGAGGMGEVYRAVDTRLERHVAVKVLPADFAANAQFRLRFEREAKLISSLTHPHICTLHDVGETDGVRYLVMELLDGETLAQRLARGPLPIAQVLSIAIQIASALEKAHREGIVHRDLKPGNIMLTKSGVKLLDFGLAKSAAAAVSFSPADATEHKPLTAEGTIVGTFQYMAPEQLEGSEADARSDIFAFGAVLYEMATGRRAFEGKTRTSLIAAIVQGQPVPISTIQPLTPPALERLIATCLAKDPDERMQTAHDVRLQLQWIAEGGSEAGIAAPELERRRRRSRATTVAAIVATALIAGAIGWMLPRREVKRSYSFTIPITAPQYRSLSTMVMSPDGTKLAFRAFGADDKLYLWVQPFDSLEVRRLQATEFATLLCWSPDSRYLYFSKGGIARVAAEGGAAQPVTSTPASAADINRDGVLLVAGAESPLTRIDPATGEHRVVTKVDAKHGEFAHMSPRFLPDGNRFLFVARTAAPADGNRSVRLYAGALDSSEVRFIADVPSAVAYAEPGYLFYAQESALIARPFDAKELRFTGEPRVVLDSVAQNISAGVFGVSQNGVLAARPPRLPYTIQRVDGDGRMLGQAGTPEMMGALRIAPDGERVAAAIADVKAGTFDIWAIGVQRPTRERIVAHGGHEDGPVWSRDGSRLFFASDRLGYSDVFVVGAEGGEAQMVVGGPGSQYPLDVSPDGTLLLYGHTNKGTRTGADLYVVPLAGGTPRALVSRPRTQGDARFSPDGRFVSYLSDETGRVEAYVRPIAGPGRARQLSTTGADGAPLWSRDGKTLFFANRRTVFRVAIDPATGDPAGEPQRAFDLPYERASLGAWDIAADGTFLIGLATEESSGPPVRVIIDWPRLLGD